MKTVGLVALAFAAGAAVFMNRDKLKPLAGKVKPFIDQFAERRRTTDAAPA